MNHHSLSAAKTFGFVLVLLLALFSTTAAAAQQAGLKEVVGALEKGYATLQDVQAGFSQTTTISAIKKVQRGHGEVMLKRPASASAMFRFDYKKPRQQIISNGKQVWFHIPENKQVMVSSIAGMFKGGNGIALTYLTGLGHLSRDFNIAFAKNPRDKKGNYQLELIPRKPTAVLAKLHLTIDQSAVETFMANGEVKDIFPIVASVIFDAGGNETRLTYSNTRVNRGISSSRFNFKVPAGVEVIKQ